MILLCLINLKQLVETSEWWFLHPLDQVASYIIACTYKVTINSTRKKLKYIQFMNDQYLESQGIK